VLIQVIFGGWGKLGYFSVIYINIYIYAKFFTKCNFTSQFIFFAKRLRETIKINHYAIYMASD